MHSSLSTRRRRGVLNSLVVGLIVGSTTAGLVALAGLTPVQAEDASSSAVRVTAQDQDPDFVNAPFPQLAVTVSQTKDLTSQGVLVSWKGGKQSSVPGSTGGTNFLQIMQCWGDDPDDPTQPDRTTCQYGGFHTPGATRDNTVETEDVAEEDLEYTSIGGSLANPTYTSIPFRSATGKTIASVVNGKKDETVNVNTNEFFTDSTTNEIPWSGSGADGSGTAKFEIQTAVQTPGLGCGESITQPDGTTAPRSCWLVIVPRAENDPGVTGITKSGLFWESWKHHLAVKLDFKPLSIACNIGAAERQVSGSELAALAIRSWQPRLCTSQGGAAYTLSTTADSDSLRTALTSDEAPLALASRPYSEGLEDSLVYAPVALTGVSIGFSIDRQPVASGELPEDIASKTGTAFTSINLTPRLLAKLLSYSYLDSLPTLADKTHLGLRGQPASNPRNLTMDPDFLAINDPEWQYESLISPSLADLLIPQGRSDTAWQVWRYIMSDKDAVDFLAGRPDPWGMVVNPWNSTNAEVNPAEVGFEAPREDFPKADPTEQPAQADGSLPLNIVAWRPYTNDLDQSAYLALRGDGQLLGPWDIQASPPKYPKAPRAVSGYQRVLALSDTASAARYQVVSASLLNGAGQFVAPTPESFLAAAAAMTPAAGQDQVYEFDSSSANADAAPTAYPLTMPVYAVANPRSKDSEARADYAAFIRYAATAGQQPGTDFGQLPMGYAPIPKGWETQALAAADAIQTGPKVPAPQPSGGSVPPASRPAANNASSGGGAVVPNAPASGSGPQNPAATGESAGLVLGGPTPKDPDVGPIGSAVPIGALAGLGAALAVPFMTRTRGKRL
ncbi:hypothetical protein [Compostimonas suwonensis]|uniref:hypothetical protein n=1 Tax=Compostimonas suwonensis TaxID=1048394 RepID=UPI0012FD04F6|nr:hypothetical protein [Compostimonas suwonensis]